VSPRLSGRVRTGDGIDLEVRGIVPRNPRACVVLVHGWGEHSGRYQELATELFDREFAVWRYDQRGHGKSGGIRGHAPRFQSLIEDLDLVTTYALKRTEGDGPLLMVGHSMGGLVTLRACQVGAIASAAMVCSAPWLSTAAPLPQWKRWMGEVLAHSLYALPIPNSLDAEVLTSDPVKREEHRNDPLVHGFMTPRLFKEVEEAQAAAVSQPHRLSTPTLFFVPGKDQLVDSSVTRSFTQNTSGADVVTIEVPEARHEIFNEVDRAVRFSEVGEYFDSILGDGTVLRGNRPTTDATGVKQDMNDGFRKDSDVQPDTEGSENLDEGVQSDDAAVSSDEVSDDWEAHVDDEQQPSEDEEPSPDIEDSSRIELKVAREKHLRLAAEYENFRKRTEIDLRVRWDRAQAELVEKILDPLDDLQRVAAWEPETTSVEAIVEGVDLVERKFMAVIQALGMEIINPAGERFDPNSMEAMLRVPAESDEQDEMVQQVFRKGYLLKGQLVRPAQVSVYKAD